MMEIMKRLLTIFAIISTLILPGLVALPVAAASTPTNPRQEVCNGIGLTSSGGGCGDNGAQFGTVMTALINLLIVAVGVIAVVMIIIAGFNFITSGGDTAKVTTARNTILYAIVGLVIVALAEVIVHFVLGTVKG